MRWLKGTRTQEYSATDQDALDLARAIAREGAPHRAVAWTLVQRFAHLYPRYGSLSDFVRAYSQPINPRWFPDGDLHRKRMRQLEGDAAAQADERARAKRRVQYAATGWEDLPAEARRLALEAIESTVESPVPAAVHFRASMAPAKATKRQAFERATRYAGNRADLVEVVRIPEGYGRGVNWFFTAPGSGAVKMLADGEEPLAPDEPPLPKDGGTPPHGPPPGVPTDQAGKWVQLWCWLPSDSGQSTEASAGAPDAAPSSSPSDPADLVEFADGKPDDTPLEDQDLDGAQGGEPSPPEEPELPPGPVMTVSEARRRGLELIGDDGPGDEDEDEDEDEDPDLEDEDLEDEDLDEVTDPRGQIA